MLVNFTLDMEELKKNYVSQVDSLKETLKFRVSSLENENSELQVISYLSLILICTSCRYMHVNGFLCFHSRELIVMRRNIMSLILPEKKIKNFLLWRNRSAVSQLKNSRGKMPNSMVSVLLCLQYWQQFYSGV